MPINREASHWPGCCCVTKFPLAAPEVDDIVDALGAEPAEPLADGMEEPAEPLVDPEVVGEPAEPLAPALEEPLDIEEPDVVLAPDPIEPPELAPGCIADEPDVVEPEPLAVGRSVPPDGAVVCATAGAVARAVAKRQAAICVLSIWIS